MMPPITVVEMPEFVNHATAILTEGERMTLLTHLSANPTEGQLIPGTGGVRKIRWRISGRGKRGGARVIYYFHNEQIPLIALDIYAKNEKTDLSEADKRTLKRLLPILVSQYLNRRA